MPQRDPPATNFSTRRMETALEISKHDPITAYYTRRAEGITKARYTKKQNHVYKPQHQRGVSLGEEEARRIVPVATREEMRNDKDNKDDFVSRNKIKAMNTPRMGRRGISGAMEHTFEVVSGDTVSTIDDDALAGITAISNEIHGSGEEVLDTGVHEFVTQTEKNMNDLKAPKGTTEETEEESATSVVSATGGRYGVDDDHLVSNSRARAQADQSSVSGRRRDERRRAGKNCDCNSLYDMYEMSNGQSDNSIGERVDQTNDALKERESLSELLSVFVEFLTCTALRDSPDSIEQNKCDQILPNYEIPLQSVQDVDDIEAWGIASKEEQESIQPRKIAKAINFSSKRLDEKNAAIALYDEVNLRQEVQKVEIPEDYLEAIDEDYDDFSSLHHTACVPEAIVVKPRKVDEVSVLEDNSVESFDDESRRLSAWSLSPRRKRRLKAQAKVIAKERTK